MFYNYLGMQVWGIRYLQISRMEDLEVQLYICKEFNVKDYENGVRIYFLISIFWILNNGLKILFYIEIKFQIYFM